MATFMQAAERVDGIGELMARVNRSGIDRTTLDGFAEVREFDRGEALAARSRLAITYKGASGYNGKIEYAGHGWVLRMRAVRSVKGKKSIGICREEYDSFERALHRAHTLDAHTTDYLNGVKRTA